jgi:uncharacterized protein YukE
MVDPSPITRLAGICASRLDAAAPSFRDALPQFEQEMAQLLDALKEIDARYLFDRDGRPGAVAAIRGALPAIEQELFDAVMEDCECELAATREALFQIAKRMAAARDIA